MKKIFFLVLALALFVPVTTTTAAGEFDYIVIKGPGITGDINVSNPLLTQDIFTFADFSKGDVNPPAKPGSGYQIVRMHADGSKGIPYDQLHYYPYTGYVYYDGIVNGFSEDGGKWYIANPEIEEPFRAILAEDARLTWIPFGVLAVLLIGFFVAYQMKPKQAK
ncbi:MAG: hypothetical protein IPO22_13350 [Anaerolineales bacterium]|nr:hypothetical protein [Anaerolineales bacterium]